jgi:hypothetical protein
MQEEMISSDSANHFFIKILLQAVSNPKQAAAPAL